MRLLFQSWHSFALLLGACFALVLLWLPGTRYPIHSDTIDYALLGESLWKEGSYSIFSEPYAKQLPLHAFLSYPIVAALGYQHGMQTSSLLAGFGVLIASFLLLRKAFSPVVGAGAVLLLLLHPGFVYLTQVGGSDPLFIMLFLLALFAYLQAERDERWYVAVGLLAGLASLTRYNGVPLFLLFLLFTLWKRPQHRSSPFFWGGLFLGGFLFSLWFLRNALTFGDPFASEYAAEFGARVPNISRQAFSNVLYYLNPIHNIFPVLLPFALYGLFREARAQPFLVLAMLTAWALTTIWWVQAMRFAFPGYPILLGFAAIGILNLLRRFPRRAHLLGAVIGISVLLTHSVIFCIYLYGSCNAFLDRTVGVLPKNLGLSTEGFYTWDQARNYLNAHAEEGAQVLALDRRQAFTWTADRVFRSDIMLSEEPFVSCPLYKITGWPREGDRIVFETEDEPRIAVLQEECPRPTSL